MHPGFLPEPSDYTDPDDYSCRSHLFTVRIWQEQLGGGRAEWRGRVQHVTGGAARYFRDWPTLIAFIQRILSEPNAERQEQMPKDFRNRPE